MVPILLITSMGRINRHLILTLLSMPDCPTIKLLTDSSNSSVQEDIPVRLHSAPHSIITINQHEGPSFQEAFRDVDIVFHSGTTLDSEDEGSSITMIDAAKFAGVRHFVFCSVLQPMRSKLYTHKAKLQVEEYLVESRLKYTILQPSHLMQNIPLRLVLNTHRLAIGFSSSVQHSFVDLLDVCLVARMIILNPTHHNHARYELVSESFTYDEIVLLISKLCVTEVHCEILSPAEFLTRMKAPTGSATLSIKETTEDAIERMLLYYNRWGLVGNPNTLQWLLQRKPTSFEEYVKRELRLGEK